MSDAELIARLRGADLYNAQHYERDPLHKQAADRIEALTAERDYTEGTNDTLIAINQALTTKLAKAVEGQKVNALERILEERGAVFDAMVDAAEDAAGKDVSFNVVVGRALRAAIAEIKGESHE